MKIYIIFLLSLLVPSLHGALWQAPTPNQWDWTAGVKSGVDGGITRFRPGGANQRLSNKNVLNAPYYLNLDEPSTTGTVAAGSTSLSVASAINFRVNDMIRINAPWSEVITWTATAAPTDSGTLSIYIGGVFRGFSITGPTTIDDYAAQVRAVDVEGWTSGGTGPTVSWTCDTTGDQYQYGLIGSQPPGGSGTIDTLEGGSFGNHRITAIDGTTFTINPARVTSTAATGAVVTTDTANVILEALGDAVPGDCVHLPTGTYNLDYGLVVPSNVTLRGDGPALTIIKHKPGGNGFGGTVFMGRALAFTDNPQTVSAGKQFKSTALTVPDATLYAAGQIISVSIGNETDNARILAGAAPRFSFSGADYVLTYLTLVTSVVADGPGGSPDIINIDTPIPEDAQFVNVYVTQRAAFPNDRTSFCGIEGLTFDGDELVNSIVFMYGCDNSWLYNVNIRKNNNYGIHLSDAVRNEINTCEIGPGRAIGTNSAAILNDKGSGNLFVNNILKDNASLAQENAGSVGNVWAYNYFKFPTSYNCVLMSHGAGNTQNLYEGNVAMGWKADGYFGTCNYNTTFRNWWIAGNDDGTVPGYAISANRGTRNFVDVGNVYGWDNKLGDARSYGNPNIGNGSSRGFAGPLGTSTRAGSTQYGEFGYPTNTYVIQPSDIFVGDFWADWKITAELTTFIDGTSSTFEVSHGDWHVHNDAKGGHGRNVLYWNGRTKSRSNVIVSAVSGDLITFVSDINSAGDPFEAVMTGPIEIWTGPDGFQEADLDVQASFHKTHNYIGSASGAGAIENPTADTLPLSLVYPSTPYWWNENSFTGPFPPVNPDAPTFSRAIIPAGERFSDLPPPEPVSPAAIHKRSPKARQKAVVVGG